MKLCQARIARTSACQYVVDPNCTLSDGIVSNTGHCTLLLNNTRDGRLQVPYSTVQCSVITEVLYGTWPFINLIYTRTQL